MPRPRLTLLVLAMLAGTTAAACDQGSGYVHGDFLYLSGCADDDVPRAYAPFEMRLLFMGQARQDDLVMLRASPSAMLPGDADEILLVVHDVEQVHQAFRDGATSVVLSVGPEAAVSVGLALHRSCAVVVDALSGVDGSVTFTHLGTEAGDRVAASFDFDLLDQRTGALVGVGFRGSLDFTVEVNLPYQIFVDTPSRVGQ